MQIYSGLHSAFLCAVGMSTAVTPSGHIVSTIEADCLQIHKILSDNDLALHPRSIHIVNACTCFTLLGPGNRGSAGRNIN